ncbi:chaperonin 10-like protein [Bisporella sp. PMI_857]|nr:chaperonin 10-like protein [Bisporella sp. PMI_857]
MASSEVPVTGRAIITNEAVDGQVNWKLEDVTLREIGPKELLVRMVATGICHTDIVFSTWPAQMIQYPKVLGHEGSGYVERVGSEVTTIKVGDAVLCSFQSCSSCESCLEKHPSFCDQFTPLNYIGEDNVFQHSAGAARGAFFGQSSFASHTVVKEASVVNVSFIVKDEEELKLFCPLGCGIQSGMGTIENLAGATEKDSVVILGLGGVGLSGIMAAKIQNCKTIIGIDRFPARLELATSFGATHVINTTDVKEDLVAQIKALTGGSGASITVDTTGHMPLITDGLEATGSRGQMIFVGVPPLDGTLPVHIISYMQSGKILRGSIEGDVTPSIYIPRMIQWFREGKLPIDKIVKFYPAESYETALADMKNGSTIKPVLIW